jgi:hypothetical protein
MASGIVSVAGHEQRRGSVSAALALKLLAGIAFWVALGAWSLTAAAAACHWISGAT